MKRGTIIIADKTEKRRGMLEITELEGTANNKGELRESRETNT